jgi:outer membrane beta-barrel protein
MDSRIQLFLVAALLGSMSAPNAMAAQPKDLELEPLVVREPERREVKVDDIDSENFEVGAYGGILNIQDFGSNAVYGVRAAYHVTEDFFVEGLYGRSELGETSFEKLSGDVELLTDDDRQFSYYNLSVGYNILPGEAFFGSKYAKAQALYLIAGVGSTKFLEQSNQTINFGLGYRVFLKDWAAIQVDFRDYIYTLDLLGKSKSTQNLELTAGLTFFF